MINLISHIVHLSSCRDRTEINAAMVDTLNDLFHPLAVTIYRCYQNRRRLVTFSCAGINDHGRFVLNAYQPDPQYCRPIERDPLLNRCRQERSAVLEPTERGTHRIVFPVNRLEHPVYLIALELSESFSADQRVALMGLIEYFSNHIALLDYGETDTLTGLASRKTFDRHLFELLGKASYDDPDLTTAHPKRRRGTRDGSSYWLAVCDIDHFKRVNDEFGHLIGDEVLIMLAQVMQQSFRFDDQLFRFGGEEFVALLQPASQENAHATFERFRADVEAENFSRVGRISISIGYSELRPNDTPTDVIDRADEALYYAKRHGRNQVACFETLVSRGELPERAAPNGDVELF